MVEAIRRQTTTGRPSGSKDFIARLEGLLGRILHPPKPGPKPKEAKNAERQGQLWHLSPEFPNSRIGIGGPGACPRSQISYRYPKPERIMRFVWEQGNANR